MCRGGALFAIRDREKRSTHRIPGEVLDVLIKVRLREHSTLALRPNGREGRCTVGRLTREHS